MINWYINKTIQFGQWIGRDPRRAHGFAAALDLLMVFLVWSTISDFLYAQQVIELGQDNFEIAHGIQALALGSVAIPIAHFVFTPWGHQRLQWSVKTYLILIFGSLLIFAIAGNLWAQSIGQRAQDEGYLLCQNEFFAPAKSFHTYARPDTLCPADEWHSKPYPPPIVMHQLNPPDHS
ncbi:hypothetical protein [Pseudovibrio sp. Ad14]|nr:hypothetical protein [Pseudovibrio sp. Ad14]KZK94486.1 hypothetical protein PsW74_04628 [Pseudovibrio sp. W74]KZL07248.1 hypothetical protein PsAD14_03630 [Pseudovibrio sp. Ad14]